MAALSSSRLHIWSQTPTKAVFFSTTTSSRTATAHWRELATVPACTLRSWVDCQQLSRIDDQHTIAAAQVCWLAEQQHRVVATGSSACLEPGGGAETSQAVQPNSYWRAPACAKAASWESWVLNPQAVVRTGSPVLHLGCPRRHRSHQTCDAGFAEAVCTRCCLHVAGDGAAVACLDVLLEVLLRTARQPFRLPATPTVTRWGVPQVMDGAVTSEAADGWWRSADGDTSRAHRPLWRLAAASHSAQCWRQDLQLVTGHSLCRGRVLTRERPKGTRPVRQMATPWRRQASGSRSCQVGAPRDQIDDVAPKAMQSGLAASAGACTDSVL